MENKLLQNKFNQEVFEAIEESKKIGYTPARFIQMLQPYNTRYLGDKLFKLEK